MLGKTQKPRDKCHGNTQLGLRESEKLIWLIFFFYASSSDPKCT